VEIWSIWTAILSGMGEVSEVLRREI
jgi:hypothetical protein